MQGKSVKHASVTILNTERRGMHVGDRVRGRRRQQRLCRGCSRRRSTGASMAATHSVAMLQLKRHKDTRSSARTSDVQRRMNLSVKRT